MRMRTFYAVLVALLVVALGLLEVAARGGPASVVTP